MSINNGLLYGLILNYIHQSESCCKLLREVVIDKPILAAKVQGLIPIRGKINNVKYSFHGGGCYFEYEGGWIDVDFGPGERCDGFDVRRLKFFLEGLKNKSQYSLLFNDQRLNNDFLELENQGIIINPKNWFNSHLYYLASRISLQ